MRKEKRIVERYVFVADDGTEFTNEAECKWHEEEREEQLNHETVEKLPGFSMFPPEVDDDYCCWFYFIKDDQELNALKWYVFSQDAAATDFYPEKYPLWVRCMYDSDGYGQLEDAVTYAGVFEEYAYNLIEKMREETPAEYRTDSKNVE